MFSLFRDKPPAPVRNSPSCPHPADSLVITAQQTVKAPMAGQSERVKYHFKCKDCGHPVTIEHARFENGGYPGGLLRMVSEKDQVAEPHLS